jgi:pimeloyl-ACP methyl ester carboxylesterase
VPVPLHYRPGAPAAMKIHVTLAPAFRESSKPDPLFVLAGGPGEAGSDVVALLGNTFRRARATRDIVFIDQRGTGLSGKLDCDASDQMDDMDEARQDAALRACLAATKTPLSSYTTGHAARDIEQVRKQLGYRSINLWGGSYGTRLAQAYARLFPANVRALVLDGVAAPDQIIPAGGRDAQAALDLLFTQCAADRACHQAYPKLRSEFAELSARVAAAPIKVALPDPRTAAPASVTIDSARFLGTVHNVLYSALDSRRLPFLIHSAYQNRWGPFIARRNLSRDLSTGTGPALVLHLAVVCAEDVPRLTPQARQADSLGSFMGSERIARLGAACAMVKVAPVPQRAPEPIGAPVLMLSGALDPVTPPRRARDAARFMTRPQHLVVANAGHGVSQLGCVPRLLRAFLDQPDKALDAKCLGDIPAANFQVGSAGPQP